MDTRNLKRLQVLRVCSHWIRSYLLWSRYLLSCQQKPLRVFFLRSGITSLPLGVGGSLWGSFFAVGCASFGSPTAGFWVGSASSGRGSIPEPVDWSKSKSGTRWVMLSAVASGSSRLTPVGGDEANGVGISSSSLSWSGYLQRYQWQPWTSDELQSSRFVRCFLLSICHKPAWVILTWWP